MKKIVLLCFLTVGFLFASSLSLPPQGGEDKTEALDIVKIKKKIEELDSAKVKDSFSVRKLMLVAGTYEAGLKEAEINIDYKKASEYYQIASKKGNTYALIRAAYIEYEMLDNFEKAKTLLSENYFAENSSVKEKGLSSFLLGSYALKEEKYDLAYAFLKESAVNYSDKRAHMFVAILTSRPFIGVEMNQQEANYHLGKACEGNTNKQFALICNKNQ